jgi:hypothetical protein
VFGVLVVPPDRGVWAGEAAVEAGVDHEPTGKVGYR